MVNNRTITMRPSCPLGCKVGKKIRRHGHPLQALAMFGAKKVLDEQDIMHVVPTAGVFHTKQLINNNLSIRLPLNSLPTKFLRHPSYLY